jgi:hypothetical protein
MAIVGGVPFSEYDPDIIVDWDADFDGNPHGAGWDLETTLDVEWAHAITASSAAARLRNIHPNIGNIRLKEIGK